MDTISNLEQLDRKLQECDAARSDAALREIFSTFQMVPQVVGLNPFGDEYRHLQIELYERIAGKEYRPANEVSNFDIEAALHRPYPYLTESAEIAGNYLLAVGALVRRLKVPKGGRVLEFGPGWGNTTATMARLGYRVTAVDVEPNFCSLIRQSAVRNQLPIEVINSDFMWAEGVTEPFDAVVFFECFHHCADHIRLLKALKKAVKPEGRLYFGGEPITDSFPMPWGVRMDGESLWAIRKNGWLELGFSEKYFEQALLSTGWSLEKHESGDHFSANVWEARHVESIQEIFAATDSRIGTTLGARDNRGISVSGCSNGWAFHGPYVRLPAGKWTAIARLRQGLLAKGTGTIDVCSDAGLNLIASASVDLNRMHGSELRIDFELPTASKDIEMRFFCIADVTFGLDALEFHPRQNASLGA